MKDEIEKSILTLLKRIQASGASEAGAMQMSQAVLNLAHTMNNIPERKP